MKVDLYQTPTEFFRTVMPVIDENFISHYNLWVAIDRIIHGKETIYNCCTVTDVDTILIIHMETERGYYIYGPSSNISAIHLLKHHLVKNDLVNKSAIQGNKLVIDILNKELRLGLSIHRNRFHMSVDKSAFESPTSDDTIREATEDDFEVLAPLMVNFHKEEFGENRIKSKQELLDDFQDSLKTPGTFLKTHNEHVVSMINLSKYPMDITYVINIYTLPEFRKKGYSKSALATVMTRLFSKNILKFGLNVKVENKSAIALFESIQMRKIYETGIYVKE